MHKKENAEKYLKLANSTLKSKAGEWIYVYKNKVSNALNNAAKTAESTYRSASNTANKWVDRIKKAASSQYNPYYSRSEDYNSKKNNNIKSDEVRRLMSKNDSEYVSKNSNGDKVFNYDEYLVNKKHPVLDALKDIGSGRKVSILDQNLETVFAGAKDYIEMGNEPLKTLQA